MALCLLLVSTPVAPVNNINSLGLAVQSSDLGEANCKGTRFKASLVFFGSTYKDSITDITALPVMAKEKGSTDYWACFPHPPSSCVCEMSLLEMSN